MKFMHLSVTLVVICTSLFADDWATPIFPHLKDKSRFPSLFTPEQQLEHYKDIGNYPSFSPPRTLIVCYSDKRMDALLQEYSHQQCDGCFSNVYFLKEYPGVAITKFGMTAPLSAMDLDRAIAWGVKRFIVVGTAARIQPNLSSGEVVICEKSIRDEGTSYNYIPRSKYAYPSAEMVEQIQEVLETNNIPYKKGTNWTTDGFYRPTKEEVEHYQKEGVLSVEMECSALFSVASLHKDVQIAMVVITSDTYGNLKWEKTAVDKQKTQEQFLSIINAFIKFAPNTK